MKFLLDQCAGRQLAAWLREQGHDVLDAWEIGADPGDPALLERARMEGRVMVTLDKDFGDLVYLHGFGHAGLVRLPDVPTGQRIMLFAELFHRHRSALEDGAVITIVGSRIRISAPDSSK